VAVVNILFVGDVVASAGRRALQRLLPGLREEFAIDFVVVNGENAAGGVGVTAKTANAIFDAGADAITLGNHTYRHREVYRYLDDEPRIIRPANYLPSQPGRGSCVIERNGTRLAIVNLSGNLYLDAARPALVEIDHVLEGLQADHVLVDMHAEATSEKVALGWYLDGRVTAVVGTHTHVPTNDARVLPGGTAYITDVGMTGSRAGVIGVVKEGSIEHLRSRMPVRYDAAEEDPWLMGVVIRCEEPGRAVSIEPVLRPDDTT
jgi:metallophosphoesterase (TIGR00282 family)